MKVIAVRNEPYTPTVYIAEISHTELCRVLQNTYGGERDMKALKPEDSVDLGAGFSYFEKLASLARTIAESVRQFEAAQPTLLRFALLAAEKSMPAVVAEHKEPTT